jgi:hypothetical protein
VTNSHNRHYCSITAANLLDQANKPSTQMVFNEVSISQGLSLLQFAAFVGIFIEKETQITGGGGETKKNSHVAREQASNQHGLQIQPPCNSLN